MSNPFVLLGSEPDLTPPERYPEGPLSDPTPDPADPTTPPVSRVFAGQRAFLIPVEAHPRRGAELSLQCPETTPDTATESQRRDQHYWGHPSPRPGRPAAADASVRTSGAGASSDLQQRHDLVLMLDAAAVPSRCTVRMDQTLPIRHDTDHQLVRMRTTADSTAKGHARRPTPCIPLFSLLSHHSPPFARSPSKSTDAPPNPCRT